MRKHYNSLQLLHFQISEMVVHFHAALPALFIKPPLNKTKRSNMCSILLPSRWARERQGESRFSVGGAKSHRRTCTVAVETSAHASARRQLHLLLSCFCFHLCRHHDSWYWPAYYAPRLLQSQRANWEGERQEDKEERQGEEEYRYL